MAFIPPSVVAAGDPLTETLWNQDVVENTSVIRAAQINVQSTTLTTATTVAVTTGGTFVDVTGVSLSITPSSSTSKILLIANVDVATASDAFVGLRLVRNTTAIGVATSNGNRIATTAGYFLTPTVMQGTGVHIQVPMQFLDSPNTTSAVTYKVQGTTNVNSSTLYINRANVDGDVGGTFRATSTITAIEVPV